MSKGSIKTWATQIDGKRDELDDDDNGALKWDGTKEGWQSFLAGVRTAFLSSSTKLRIGVMRYQLTPLVKERDLTMSQSLSLFELITLTYPRYIDKGSREAAENLGIAILERDEGRDEKFGVTEHIINWLWMESERVCTKGAQSSTAPSSLFALLSWSCAIYTSAMRAVPSFPTSISWPKLVGSMALLLNAILEDSDNEKSRKKEGVVRSSVDRMRRAVRTSPLAIGSLLATLLAGSPTTSATPFLGLTIDVILHLKNYTGPDILTEFKGKINSFFVEKLVMSRVAVPVHQSDALIGFFRSCVTQSDLSVTYLSTMEKALLRSPEIALHVCKSFFKGYQPSIPLELFKRILAPILSNTKSSNATTRTAAVELFKVLLYPSADAPERTIAEDVSTHAAREILVAPLTSKSVSPEHRVALYTMLGYIPPSQVASEVIAGGLPTLLGKETNEPALNALCRSLVPHILSLVQGKKGLEKSIADALVKESMSASKEKATTRRAVMGLIGNVLWLLQSQESESEGTKAFAAAMIPTLEASLKTAASLSPSSTSGIFEGYVAMASLLGPVGVWFPERIDTIIAAHQPVFTFTAHGSSKSSFLVWEKVYQKLAEVDDQIWFLRALEAVVKSPKEELTAPAESRRLLGLALIHGGVESRHATILRDSISRLTALTMIHPKRMNSIIIAGLDSYVSRPPPPPKDSETDLRHRHQQRLTLILACCASYAEDTPPEVKKAMLEKTLLLAHHPVIGGDAHQSWVELILKTGLDPNAYVGQHTVELVRIVCRGGPASQESRDMRTARFRAVTTLAFVNPEATQPLFIRHLRADLDPLASQTLTDEDLAIWRAPAGVPFIDVLASKRPAAIQKGKEQDIQKWEAEVRKTLKKDAKLSKQDEALVKAQLVRESEIRRNVEERRQSLEEGLSMVQSLIATRSEAFTNHLSAVLSLVLACALGRPADLAGSTIFNVYIDLGSCCDSRLGSTSKWAGVATLRALGATCVPEDMRVESIEQQTLRVLYRCCTLAEHEPFDPATYSYLSPLLTSLVEKGGLDPADDETALEQLTLALNLIRSQVMNVSDTAYPRVAMLSNVTRVLSSQLQLAKQSASLLIDMGEAIQVNASREEIDFLVKCTLVEESHARNAVLQSLQPFDLTDLDWSPAIWVACHDRDEQNSRLARHLWEDNGLDVPETFVESLLPFLDDSSASIRLNAAYSFPEAIESWPSSIEAVCSALQSMYTQKVPITGPQFDSFGILVTDPSSIVDQWPSRVAIAKTMELLAEYLSEKGVTVTFEFLIAKEALGDRQADVRRAMLQAGVRVVDFQGPAHISYLMELFEDNLASSSSSVETSDHLKEAIIILFGHLAKHLEPGDDRLPTIVDRLIQALKTPSEQVQFAVSECLAPLVGGVPEPEKLLDRLISQLVSAPRYAERRGAAYGVAGTILGLGISSMKVYDVLGRLKSSLENKTHFEPRQGAMFAVETLAATLGRLFEPFINQVLPMLLTAFGDATADVREATTDASKALMASVSAYGVKLILPTLLDTLQEKQWRTKKGAIEILGSMAYCSPKQLSISLPTIIPRLTGVLTDSHTQVRTAANKSLKQFGEVISNPEIQKLVPTLLKALVDPDKIPAGLASLIKTSFMHYIDSPSLALVIPILERGLKQRGDPKRKSCQIVGNMASLTDPGDFVPYLPRLLPLVHIVLVDPVPEARATAAKALGTLVERLGEINFPDLVPGLLQTLKSDTSAIDRQGAAQGLSEVLSGLGMERLEGLLPDIINNSTSTRAYVREGFMSLLVYLPATFGTRFTPHLSKVVTPILSGLADDEQAVQEAAMKAGRMIIVNYSNRAIDLLLPELETTMFDPGWRIRQSSLTLIGELLFKISGISGKAEGDEEEDAPPTEMETAAVEVSRKALTELLGKERRDRLLSGFYILRQDAVTFVRQSAIQIWKALVHNTPRTIREVLPALVDKVVDLLATAGEEQRETAARTVGELCRKFGERIVAEIVPLLRVASQSRDDRTREGVCMALIDIMENTTDTQREGHEDEVVTIVRKSLVDPAANVRAAAAKAFDTLQRFMGARAIDQTIPTLLEALRQPGEGSGTALQALKEVMNVRATTVFPVLIPTLLATPMTTFNLRAMSSLVSVAGAALSKRIGVILTALVKMLETKKDADLRTEGTKCMEAVLVSVLEDDFEGLNTLMMLLLGWSRSEVAQRRASAARTFGTFCSLSEVDASLYRVDWIRQIVAMFDDPDMEVVKEASTAFGSFVKSVPKDEYEGLVVPLRRSIESTGSAGRNVPGFSMPNAIAPFVPVLIAGLTTGSNEQREQSAYAIADLVDRTEEASIKPFVVPFTGPLIRVTTQATNYPPGVKVAILSALEKEVILIPSFVKPFFPQLQRTFAKAVGDTSSVNVRNKAAEALGALMKHQPRVDQICTELLLGVKNNLDSEEELAASYAYAIAMVVRSAHASLGDAVKENILNVVTEAFDIPYSDAYVNAIAQLFASMAPFPDMLRPLVNSHLTHTTPPSQVSASVILEVLEHAPSLFNELGVAPSVAKKIASSCGSENILIARPARGARDVMRSCGVWNGDDDVLGVL